MKTRKIRRKTAIKLTQMVWDWAAETGKNKYAWPKWYKYDNLYDYIPSSCFLCLYNDQQGGDSTEDCTHCPYFQKFEHQCFAKGHPYKEWEVIRSAEGFEKTRKKYAALFVEELKELEPCEK